MLTILAYASYGPIGVTLIINIKHSTGKGFINIQMFLPAKECWEIKNNSCVNNNFGLFANNQLQTVEFATQHKLILGFRDKNPKYSVSHITNRVGMTWILNSKTFAGVEV